jgi:CheY-like chemotaxis protein
VENEYYKNSVAAVETARNLSDAEMVKRKSALQISDAHILVVDDVLSNLMIAKGLMEPYGVNVYLVKTGQKAVDIVREGKIRFNAIFMDHMMPEMDGIETVRVIREEIDTEYAKTVPIIALTANISDENKSMFLEHGFQDFLSKPIDILELERILHTWAAH